MSYLIIEDFKSGLDTRRSIITAPPGTLQLAKNVHISRGGEIEKRKGFIPVFPLPGSTVGFASNVNNTFTFGPASEGWLPGTNTFQYQCLHEDGHALVRIVDWTLFQGAPFYIANFADGSNRCFYGSTRIAAFATGGDYAAYVARCCVTLGSKVYVGANGSLIFCENDAPTTWATNANGSGIVDLSTKWGGAENIWGVGVYINRLAVYTHNSCLILTVDPDPLKNALLQVVPNIGTGSPKSIAQFGDADNFILAQTGIRSLRARDMSLTAGIFDIGTPIDNQVTTLVRTVDPTTLAMAAAAVEPLDGRYMLGIGQTIFVFSYFPSSHISAWSTYDIGAFGSVQGWGIVGMSTYVRVGNFAYQYGGADGQQYDQCDVDVILPYLDAKSPSTIKQIEGIDAAVTGRWDVSLGMEPSPPYSREMIARLDHETFSMGRIEAVGQGTHFGVRFQSAYPGAATISNAILHYTGGETD